MGSSTSTAAQEYLEMQSLIIVRPPLRIRLMARYMLISLVILIGGMVMLPWQQTSRATGRVVAYDPTERPQTVEAPIYGRVVRWGEGIVEGARVKKGQLVMEIADNDPLRAERLLQQVEATRAKAGYAKEKVESYFVQINEYNESRKVVIESYQKLVEVASRKIDAAKQDLDAATSAERQYELDNERQSTLAQEGVVADVKAQEAQAKYEQAVSKRKAAESYVSAAESEKAAKEADLQAKTREANTKVNEADAKHQQAQGEEALAQKELSELEGKLAQFSQRAVEAPRDGLIQRLYVAQNAQMLKEGDPLFIIVPETASRAVELWVDGNDVPLVRAGGEVRIQIEGWPAVQFAGWPSVAVGSFGGVVTSIDGTDDGKGKFRLLVRPKKDEDWPSGTYLRQGARVNGWVLLNRVPLCYEIWRQINGFPPVISKNPPSDAGAAEKEEKTKIKVPK